MSKIICELCGTAYPETSTQCPICGFVRPADAQGVPSQSADAADEGSYQHVKGGRFSKSNVRKRNAGSQSGSYNKPTRPERSAAPERAVKQESPASRERPVRTASEAPDVHTSQKKNKKSNGNMGLVITIFVLLLAIIAVVLYILIKFFIPTSAPVPEVTEPTVTEAPTEEVTEAPGEVPCQDLVLDTYEIYLENAGDHTYLVAMPEPFDTTDEIIFESASSSTAMVDSDGRVTAVYKGETTITVTCGIVSAQCQVYVGVAKATFELTVQEAEFTTAGETMTIYDGSIPTDNIDWSSDDESVATIADGVVTAVGSGTTTVYGDYNGNIVSCVVRCMFAAESATPNTPTTPAGPTDDTDPTESTETVPQTEPTTPTEPVGTYKGPYKLKNLTNPEGTSDVSIRVGETFWLELVDSQGKTVKSATWKVEGDECTVDNGTIKGVKAGDDCYIVITFDGQTFKCRVRVRR